MEITFAPAADPNHPISERPDFHHQGPHWVIFQNSGHADAMSGHQLTADMRRLHRHVGFVPTAEVAGPSNWSYQFME
jgi:hypothetical protein